MSMGMTVIKGSGDGIEVVINGVVKQEIARQNRLREAERQRASIVETRRNQMLTERRAAMRKKIFGKRSAIRRALDKLDTAYCVVMGTVILVAVIVGVINLVVDLICARVDPRIDLAA